MEKFKITKEQLELIYNHSNFIHTSMDNKYSFIPFWFEHKDDNNITLHSLGNLPKDLSDYITNDRNATSNVPVNEEDHKKEFPLTPEECFKPNTESSAVEKQCPLCDGKGIREFPNCTPPIKEPCPGCEGEKKYTSMKDAFGMMTPKEAKEVSENMKEHNIFDKDTAEYKYFEEENHFFHAKKVKLKYKIPMKQMVVDEHNQIWNYRVNDDEVVYYYYGQAAEDNTKNSAVKSKYQLKGEDIENKTINFGINLNDSDTDEN